MKLKLFLILFGITFLSGHASAENQWIYRDLKANTLPISKCESKQDATARATKPANFDRYTNRFCEIQGYGWHLTEVIDQGTTRCNRCGDDIAGLQYSCFQEDVIVTCKRLKPGSVGMLPNELVD